MNILDKDHDMERERELYDYQHESSPPHQIHSHQAQTVHLTPNHPHLRHVGHPQTSIICIQQQPHNQPAATIIASNSITSQNSAVVVQNITSQQPASTVTTTTTAAVAAATAAVSSNQQQQTSTISHEMHEIQMKKENVNGQSHFQHHQQNGEIRPSVIESSQPMVIECT